jgi:hypothetical protein
MLRPQFIVVFHDHEWKVRHEGRHYGPYTTERGAILAAIEAAHRAGGHGHEPRVLSEGPTTKKLYVEWTYGDPYPPPDMEAFRASTRTVGSQANRSRGSGGAF